MNHKVVLNDKDIKRLLAVLEITLDRDDIRGDFDDLDIIKLQAVAEKLRKAKA